MLHFVESFTGRVRVKIKGNVVLVPAVMTYRGVEG